MAEEGGVIAQLFERNCQELLQEIFLYLDPESLHTSRQVSQRWNDFIREAVWGSQRGHRALERRLHNNWLTSEPRVFSVDYTDQMFFHYNKNALALDNKYLVVGLSHVGQGGAKVRDLATQEIVAHLPHQDSQGNDREVWCVQITQTWIITQGQEKALLWSRDNFQQVLTLDFQFNSCMETEDGLLFLAHHQSNILSLYKLKTNSFTPELIFEIEREGYPKFATIKDAPVLVREKRLFDYSGETDILIDQIHETEKRDEMGNTSTALYGIRGVIDYSFEAPHLAILTQEKIVDGDDDDDGDAFDIDVEEDVPHKLILKVFNIEKSRLLPLYSIDINKMEYRRNAIFLEYVSILLENNLIRVSSLDMILVFDATTIEDGDSVLTSMRKIPMDGSLPLEDSLVLFNKYLGVSKQQDTITQSQHFYIMIPISAPRKISTKSNFL